MATTSYFSFSFTESENQIIRQMLQLESNKYKHLTQELNALLDICKMCEEHQLPYQFYDDKQFYCPKCLANIKPTNFCYIEDTDDNLIKQRLDEELSRYQGQQLPVINFEERAESIREERKQNINSGNIEQINSDSQISQLDQLTLSQVLEKRKKFVEVQDFISYISIQRNNRKIHDEMHNTDEKMKPKWNFDGQQDNSDFESIFQKFLKTQI